MKAHSFCGILQSREQLQIACDLHLHRAISKSCEKRRLLVPPCLFDFGFLFVFWYALYSTRIRLTTYFWSYMGIPSSPHIALTLAATVWKMDDSGVLRLISPFVSCIHFT